MFRNALLGAALIFFPGGAAGAEDLPVLNVYTYDSFVSEWGPGPRVEQAFEAQCKCDLQFTALGDGAALLARIQLEGERTKADVVLGLDTNLTARAAETGLFASHDRVVAGLDLPIEWTDTRFLPFDWGYFAFVYDRTKLSDVPRSFTELAAMPEDFKIIIEDPRSSTPGLGLLMWVKAAYGDRAPEIWAGLAPHILTVTKGWSEAYGLFLKGEADMVLSYTTSPAYHIIAEQDDSKAAAIFDEGHYLQIEVAGRLVTSKQPKLAAEFLDFMLSDAFQSIIPTGNWMYPVLTPKSGLPEGFENPVPAEKALLMSPKQAVDMRKDALDEWLHALSK
ncbi:MAG: thiamine ABC transporter substrate binding subunit [Rhodobacteraceae bacterium]|nr:thiamine ABC transporter substrate binding subunit [Paracoccaceae bacterium]